MEELKQAKEEINKEAVEPAHFNIPKKSKKKIIIFCVIGAIVFGLAFGITIWMVKGGGSKLLAGILPTPTITSTATATPTPYANSPINGVRVSVGVEKKHPLGVMIENHTDARPQYGLSKADLVYESMTEGNISRMLAIFQTQNIETLGPVRSARTYFVDWCQDYNCIYAHCGGNEDSWAKIDNDGILDLNEFFFGGYFWRDYNNYFAPHNLFTSTEKLYQAAKDQNWAVNDADFGAWEFKDEGGNQLSVTSSQKENKKTTPASPTATPEPLKQIVRINYSTDPYYSFYYEYDAANNVYKRFDANGNAQMDALDNSQVAPKNLVVMTVERWFLNDYEGGWAMQTVGEGSAKFFIDGKETTGKWVKNSSKERTQFYDDAGNKIVFNRGQIWINIVPPDIGVVVE